MSRKRRDLQGKPPTQRQLRAGELVRHALVDILAREDFRDPVLENVSVTIGEVRCSPDLRHANVFVTALGLDAKEDREALAEALNKVAGFLCGRLGREIDMKFTPELHFHADNSFDTASQVDALLSRPQVRQDLNPDDDED